MRTAARRATLLAAPTSSRTPSTTRMSGSASSETRQRSPSAATTPADCSARQSEGITSRGDRIRRQVSSASSSAACIASSSPSAMALRQ